MICAFPFKVFHNGPSQIPNISMQWFNARPRRTPNGTGEGQSQNLHTTRCSRDVWGRSSPFGLRLHVYRPQRRPDSVTMDIDVLRIVPMVPLVLSDHTVCFPSVFRSTTVLSPDVPVRYIPYTDNKDHCRRSPGFILSITRSGGEVFFFCGSVYFFNVGTRIFPHIHIQTHTHTYTHVYRFLVSFHVCLGVFVNPSILLM